MLLLLLLLLRWALGARPAGSESSEEQILCSYIMSLRTCSGRGAVCAVVTPVRQYQYQTQTQTSTSTIYTYTYIYTYNIYISDSESDEYK